MGKECQWKRQTLAAVLTVTIFGLVLVNISELNVKEYVPIFDSNEDASLCNTMAFNTATQGKKI